jgi:hypothetical protein
MAPKPASQTCCTAGVGLSVGGDAAVLVRGVSVDLAMLIFLFKWSLYLRTLPVIGRNASKIADMWRNVP